MSEDPEWDRHCDLLNSLDKAIVDAIRYHGEEYGRLSSCAIVGVLYSIIHRAQNRAEGVLYEEC